ncbi:MAG: ImpA family metalloprotease, partial [Shewanella sp.]
RNLAQADLGEYVTDRANLSKGTNAHYAYPATASERKTITVPYSGQWTTTGWYALPGQTIKFSRLDNTNANVEIKLNYHRRNTNRAFEQKVYRAPLELAQQRIKLAKGQSIEFSTPYGGPVYLYISGGEGALSVDINAQNVAKHPSIMDFSNPAEITAFNDKIQNTELPHVDLRTEGAEQHLRRDRFMNAIGGNVPDVNALLNSIVDDHINSVYTLAGLKIQGKSLTESLPADVLSSCQALFGQDCTDASLHTRTIIQHANYDQNAHCGSGCSGNPWDAAWNISPTGWGDNHELGHNLQTNRLNVQYATAANSDNWTGYGSRAGENSNNIFPYVVKWKTHYLRDGNTDIIKDGHMNHKDLFYVFMSDAAGTTDTSGKRVVFGANCKVLDIGEDRYTAPWASNAYAVHNGYRMAFYIQMALKAHGMTLSDGTTLTNGFNLFTLLYQHSRI